MNSLMTYLVVFVPIYLFASIPWGFVIGKLKGINIKEHGSGNIGATNVNRVLGKKFGIVCFFLDFMKGYLPVLIVIVLVRKNILPTSANFVVPVAAFACVAGHIWSIYLKFNGGKGIATAAGVIAALAPYSLLITLIAWILVFQISRYVSLASIAAAVLLPLSAWIFTITGVYPISTPILIILLLISLIAILRHRTNIKRLLNGTENKFVKKSPEKNKYVEVPKDENHSS